MNNLTHNEYYPDGQIFTRGDRALMLTNEGYFYLYNLATFSMICSDNLKTSTGTFLGTYQGDIINNTHFVLSATTA